MAGCALFILAIIVIMVIRFLIKMKKRLRQLNQLSDADRRKTLHKKFNRQLVSKRLHSIADHASIPYTKKIHSDKDFYTPEFDNKVYHATNGVYRKLTGKVVSRGNFQKEFIHVKHFAIGRLHKALKQRRLGLGTMINITSDYLSKSTHLDPRQLKLMVMMHAARVIQNLPFAIKLFNNA